MSDGPNVAVAGAVLALCGLCATPASASQATDTAPSLDREPRQLIAAVHTHTEASSGAESIDGLVRLAHQAGIDVLLLTENFGYRFRYAPWPLRPFVEARFSSPLIGSRAMRRYLQDIRAAQGRHPKPLLLVGAEVLPYYYWTGSLWRGDLVLHDAQRNVIVVPPVDEAVSVADEARFFADLPLIANASQRGWGPRSLALLIPGLVACGWGARLLRRRRRAPPAASAPLIAGCAALGFTSGLALLAWNFPYSYGPLQPYDADLGHQPAQVLLDHVRERGGLAFWSMPEARDDRRVAIGPLSVHLLTRPDAGLLTDTEGFAGFGGVYADTITTIDAGGAWDAALGDYMRDRRAAAPFVIGESAFHFVGQAGKQLGDVLTVLLAAGDGAGAAFDSLAKGRSYALRREAGGADLRLTEFAMRGIASPDGGDAPGRAGDTVRPAAGGLRIDLRVDDAGGAAVPIAIELIRGGRIHRRWKETTPFARHWVESVDESAPRDYFRVVVRGPRPAYLVSNPIFVERSP